ncbi:hypothetical protein ACWD4P_20320 [Kitasatospora sp. NPDC002543]
MSTGPVDELPARARAVLGPFLDAMAMNGARVHHAGDLPRLLGGAGFEVEEALDATPYCTPASEAVHARLRLPWEVVRRLGDPAKWLNLRSTVEMYAVREHVAWYVHTAVKPSR